MMQDPRFELLRARVDALADGATTHEMRIDPSYLKELLDEIEQFRIQQSLLQRATVVPSISGQ